MSDEDTTLRGSNDAALLAAAVAMGAAVSPVAVVRARSGPVRDSWVEHLRSLLPADAPLGRLPAGAGEDRIFGGLDVAATLACGRLVQQSGIIEQCAGGVLIVPMAERLTADLEARLAVALDGEGSCGPVLVLFDESVGDDEHIGACLGERSGCWIELGGTQWLSEPPFDRQSVERAKALWPEVRVSRAQVDAICRAASALGIRSLRAPLLAVRLSCASAALEGRIAVSDVDLESAARLVLAPRAMCAPSLDSEAASLPQDVDRDCDGDAPGANEVEQRTQETSPTEASALEVVLQAVGAVLPEGVLTEAGRKVGGARRKGDSSGRTGEIVPRRGRGRRLRASRIASPSACKIDVLATLRSAIPWQRLRQQRGPAPTRVALVPSDLRYERRAIQSESAVVFLVDASGSSAMHRLAEVKGAIEILLSQCYARRESVALVAFRGRSAEMLLPPTRALARARRSLAALPGGGATPLASGLEAAHEVVRGCLRRGQRPFLVLLTDAKANIGRDGRQGRAAAEQDAHSAARLIASDRIAGILIDTGPRASPEARRLADVMHAGYRPLPHADARRVHDAVALARPR
jgi:magnesium chelatase subunit D